MERHQRHREPPAGEPHALGHFRDNADARVRIVLPRDQEDAIVAAHIDLQRDRHARKRHHVVQGNDS